MSEGIEGLFARTEEFPSSAAQARLAALVGLDETRDRLVADAVVLLHPTFINDWSTRVHGGVIPAVDTLLDRTPLFIFAGDVGVGKTELAEVLGQAISREADADVTLYPLSLTARGRGAVGEMTTLLTRAFERVSKDFARAADPTARLAPWPCSWSTRPMRWRSRANLRRCITKIEPASTRCSAASTG